MNVRYSCVNNIQSNNIHFIRILIVVENFEIRNLLYETWPVYIREDIMSPGILYQTNKTLFLHCGSLTLFELKLK